METRRTATALVLFLCTAFVLWWAATTLDTATADPTSLASSSYIVFLYHSVENNAHVYRGTIETSACESVSTGGQAQDTNPPKLFLRLERIESPECPLGDFQPSMTEEPFQIAIGSENAMEPVVEQVTIDDTVVAFSVIEE